MRRTAAHPAPIVIAVLALILSLLAPPDARAGGSDDTLPRGVWIDRDYGYVLDIGRRHSQLFDLVDQRCVRHQRLRNDQLQARLGKLLEASSERLVFESRPNRYTYLASDALPAACAALGRRRDSDPLSNAELLWSTIAVHQASLEAGGIDWLAQRERLRADARSATTSAALFEALSNTLAPLQDAHLTLSDGEREFEGSKPTIGGVAVADAPSWKTQRWALKDFLDSPQSPLLAAPTAAGNRRLLVGELPDEIGYLAVLAMAGYSDALDAGTGPLQQAAAAAAVFDNVLDTMQNKRALVVDLRYNEGGYDAVALALADRLATVAVNAFSKQVRGPDGLSDPWPTRIEPVGHGFRGPIAVLIGPYTISAGEVGALALRALPTVRLVGESSYGAWSDAMPKALPNGWQFSVAPEIYRSPAGELYISQGLQPDQQAPTPVLGEPQARYAPAIAAAVQWLTAAAQSTN